MLCKVILILALGISIIFSVRLRMQLVCSEKERTASVIVSPLSEAISQMVGIAGGIYVALVLLFGFLEIEFPQQIQIANITLNPVALGSILLACIQPLLPVLWRSIRNFLFASKYL